MKAEPKYAGLPVSCPRCGKPNRVPMVEHPGLAETDRLNPVPPEAASSDSPRSATAAITETVRPETSAQKPPPQETPPPKRAGETTRVQAVVPDDTDRIKTPPPAAEAPKAPMTRPSAASAQAQTLPASAQPSPASAAPKPPEGPVVPPAPKARSKAAFVALCVLLGILVGAGGAYQFWYVPRNKPEPKAEGPTEKKPTKPGLDAEQLAEIERRIAAALAAKLAAQNARQLAESAGAPTIAKDLWADAEQLAARAEASQNTRDYPQAEALWGQARDQYLAAKDAAPLTPEQMAERLTRPAGSFSGHKVHVNAVAFSPNGKLLASGGDDNRVRLWDPVAHQTIAQLDGGSDDINAVAFSPDGQWLAGAGDAGNIRLWNTQQQGEALVLRGHQQPIQALAFSPDGTTLASTGDDGTVRLWEAASGKGVATLTGNRMARGIAFSPDGKRLATGGAGFLTFWDLASQQGDTTRNRMVVVQQLAWNPDGSTVAIGGTRSASLLNVQTKRPARLQGSRVQAARFDMRVRPPMPVAFNADGKLLAVGNGANVDLFETARRRLLTTVRTGRSQVNALAVSPDGRLMATAHNDGLVRLWGTDE